MRDVESNSREESDVDFATEQKFSLKTLASEFPSLRQSGKKLGLATVWRWTDRGVKGVKLEYVGTTRVTSREALTRFFDRIKEESSSRPSSLIETPTARRKAHETANRQLENTETSR